MSYEAIRQDIFSAFSQPYWSANGIRVYPATHSGPLGAPPHIIVNYLLNSPKYHSHMAKKEYSGMAIFQVMVPRPNGYKDLSIIAQTLDTYFQATRFPLGTEFGLSHIDIVGVDKVDKNLFRGDYRINFKLFGE